MSQKTYLRNGVYYSDFRIQVGGKSKRIRKKLCRDKEAAEKMATELEAHMRKGLPEPTTTFFGMLKVGGMGTDEVAKPGMLNIQLQWDPAELIEALTGNKNLYVEIRGLAK
ncbi:MAG: hypothetical protein V3V74_07575 [Nitrosomonadaceae bacterium]